MKRSYILKSESGEYFQGLRQVAVPEIDDCTDIAVVNTDKLRLAKRFNFEYATIVCIGVELYSLGLRYQVVSHDEEAGIEPPRAKRPCKVIDFFTRGELEQ